MMRFLDGKVPGLLPFVPPFLKVRQVGDRADREHPRLARPAAVARLARRSSRLAAHQLQLTIADLVAEVHDTHHPIASSLYYEDQRREARRRAPLFLRERVPKFLGYFEQVLARKRGSRGKHLVGVRTSYVDLSLFQIVEGLRYAFPRAMSRIERKNPRVVALHDAVAARPRIARYLDSDRRISFNEEGIFRHYPELDAVR